MRKEKIDHLPLGEILRALLTDGRARRPASSCEGTALQRLEEIKRKDGRPIPDLTTDVIAQLPVVTPDPSEGRLNRAALSACLEAARRPWRR